MFRPFIHFTMPWERKPRRNAVEESAWIRDLIRIRWAAYKAIQAGGTYSIGNKEIYTLVRKRLKRMLLENEEKLSRFRYLDGEDTPTERQETHGERAGYIPTSTGREET